MLETIRELSGSAMITLPSSAADFDNPAMAKDIERYLCSGTTDAKSRIALMRQVQWSDAPLDDLFEEIYVATCLALVDVEDEETTP